MKSMLVTTYRAVAAVTLRVMGSTTYYYHYYILPNKSI